MGERGNLKIIMTMIHIMKQFEEVAFISEEDTPIDVGRPPPRTSGYRPCLTATDMSVLQSYD